MTTDTIRSPTQDPFRWVMLFGVWLIYYCFGLIVASTAPLVKPIVEDLDLSLSAMGSLMGAWPLLYIVVAIPAGVFLDRFDIRRALLISAALIMASGLLRAVAVDYFTMFIAIALFGIGGPLVSVGAPKLISAWFEGKERGLAMGLYITGPGLGVITTLSLTNSVLMPLTGDSWRACMLIFAALAAVGGCTWFFIARHESSKADEHLHTNATLRGQIDLFKSLLRLPPVRIVLLMGVGMFAFNHGLNNWLPEILRSGGMSAVQAGYWATMPIAVGIVGALIVPRFATPQRRIPILVTLLSCAACSALVIGLAQGDMVAAGLFLQGASRSAMVPILLLVLMDSEEIGSQRMGAAGGLFFSVGELGGVLGPLTIGTLADLTGAFTVSLMMLAAIAATVAALALRLGRILHPVAVPVANVSDSAADSIDNV